MGRILVLCVFLCGFTFASYTQTLAFPEAEGFGKYTKGGRGGRVFVVSNLNDKGAGSFREAVSAKVPRVIVFAVSGTIHLQSPLSIGGDVTIAGQSAPGDGICLADYPVGISGNNVIIRYMRFRMGAKNQKGGMVDGNGRDAAFSSTRANNIIIDHCSFSWSTDEAFSIYAGDSTTVQWNLISEPLNYSYHFETGDKDYEHHGFGGIWGGKHLSAHHNLFAHCVSRTPRFDGIRNSKIENVDFRNNVIYNWESNNVYAGEGGNYNIVNNYYKPGPNTRESVKSRVANPYKTATIPFGKFYINGNHVDLSPEVTQSNWKGVVMEKGASEDKEKAKLSAPFVAEPIDTQTAGDAYLTVLAQAGASYKRDTMDIRIINDVKNRTGRIIDVQGGYPHGTEYDKTIGAWPNLKSATASADSDKDGMPDNWEKANRLDTSKDDSSAFTLDKSYSNIEVYLNSLLQI